MEITAVSRGQSSRSEFLASLRCAARRGILLALVATVPVLAGCNGDDDDDAPAFRDATTSDLANGSFALGSGDVLDPALGGGVTLEFGTFDSGGTAPFAVRSGSATASGLATLSSPLALELLVTDSDLPFTDQQRIELDAQFADNQLRLSRDGTTVDSAARAAADPPAVMQTRLDGRQEVPSVDTQGSGSASLSISPDSSEIRYTLRYQDTATVTQAHIHAGATGENGPIIMWLCESTANPAPDNLPTPPTCPAAPGVVTGTLTDADLIPATDPSVPNFGAAVAAIQGGEAYINVHSTDFPPGELRGQLGAAELSALLSGDQEVPSVSTDGSGEATVTLNASHTEIEYSLTYRDTDSVVQAHIHTGEAGTNGGVLMFLCANGDTPVNRPASGPVPPACPAAPGTVTGRLSAADFSAAGDVATFQDAVAGLLAGRTYINVHSQSQLSGEIRGQIGAAELNAVLSGAQEVPAVTTEGSGSAVVRLNGTQTGLTYRLSYADTAQVTQAHIHTGEARTNGGILLWLCETSSIAAPGTVSTPPTCGAAPATVSGTLSANDLLTADGVSDFPTAVDRLLSGRTYANVHSTASAPGEIRGQIGAVQLLAVLSGDQEVPAVDTPGNGLGSVVLSGSQSRITYSLSYADIAEVTQAHIHFGAFGENGGILLWLCETAANRAPGGIPTPPECPAVPGSVGGSLSAADLLSTNGVTEFAGAVDSLISGTTYMNVHTTDVGSGEIRGQVGSLD